MQGNAIFETTHGRDGFRIELTRDEALVLFESLATALEGEEGLPFLEGDELCRALLSRLVGVLEGDISETFLPSYGEIIEGARERLATEYLGAAGDEGEGA